jgi:serine/threonine-protein kinase
MAGWIPPGYDEVHELGAGGGGRVVLARHQASGSVVAIKYLSDRLMGDPRFVAAFRGEARMLAGLVNPHVARLHAYVETANDAAIVMEAVDGAPLRKVLNEHGAAGPEAALVVLKGSLLGLAAAHDLGVVHRDYKPDNVLVQGNGQSKLSTSGSLSAPARRAYARARRRTWRRSSGVASRSRRPRMCTPRRARSSSA